jgi:hypothetical protein
MKKAFALMCLFLASCGGANSIETSSPKPGALAISWKLPQKNVDGTALTNIAGYRIDYGTDPLNLNRSVLVVGLSTMLEGLAPGVYYATVSTVNTFGETSDPAGPVSELVR